MANCFRYRLKYIDAIFRHKYITLALPTLSHKYIGYLALPTLFHKYNIPTQIHSISNSSHSLPQKYNRHLALPTPSHKYIRYLALPTRSHKYNLPTQIHSISSSSESLPPDIHVRNIHRHKRTNPFRKHARSDDQDRSARLCQK